MTDFDPRLHAGLRDLLDCPLLSAIQERRSRRVSRGTSVRGPALAHDSANAPAPLDELEEAILVVAATGLTGPVMHDGPLAKPSGTPEDLGSPFVNVVGRAASSADNSQATAFFMINDAGIWLVKAPDGRAALDWLRGYPASWLDWSEDHWRAAAGALKCKVHDGRLEFPREFPFYIGWNKQLSNRPGTTMFLPVVDCTRQYINVMLILLSEPEGERPLVIDDWQPFRPCSLRDWLAWAAVRLGLGPDIPYQPIGGVERARGGFVNPDIPAALGAGHTLRTDYECYFLLQNMMLVGQAMGLGGWIHGSVWPPYVVQRDTAKGWYGLGFRRAPAARPRGRRPPLPAAEPNPVGIDGVLEGLCPPYVASMDDAVDRLIEEKYGEAGVYGDTDAFAAPYRSPDHAEAYLRAQQHHPPEAIAYTKEICRYIHHTYGRFPAHVDAFYVPGVWLQFSHLELEYYRKYFDAGLYARQDRHDSAWHGDGAG